MFCLSHKTQERNSEERQLIRDMKAKEKLIDEGGCKKRSKRGNHLCVGKDKCKLED